MTREEKLATLIYDSVWVEENESVFVEKVKSAIKNFLDSENTWHKVSEELPEEKHYKERTLQGIREWSESESVLVIDNHYLKTVDYLKNGEWLKLRTHPKDCDGFPIQYLYWMDIPKPPKED